MYKVEGSLTFVPHIDDYVGKYAVQYIGHSPRDEQTQTTIQFSAFGSERSVQRMLERAKHCGAVPDDVEPFAITTPSEALPYADTRMLRLHTLCSKVPNLNHVAEERLPGHAMLQDGYADVWNEPSRRPRRPYLLVVGELVSSSVYESASGLWREQHHPPLDARKRRLALPFGVLSLAVRLS